MNLPGEFAHQDQAKRPDTIGALCPACGVNRKHVAELIRQPHWSEQFRLGLGLTSGCATCRAYWAKRLAEPGKTAPPGS